ncbi:hypothetical protein LTS10_003602 [Elasticomyces elasticus]|nr:hypothetical protein LTS10_003602 [Elasticomyces elasticus]
MLKEASGAAASSFDAITCAFVVSPCQYPVFPELGSEQYRAQKTAARLNVDVFVHATGAKTASEATAYLQRTAGDDAASALAAADALWYNENPDGDELDLEDVESIA